MEDGGGEHAAPRSGAGDREGRALEVLELELVVARRGREALDVAREGQERAAGDVVDHRHREALGGRGGDADVERLVDHDLLALVVEAAVWERGPPQRPATRPPDVGQGGEADPGGVRPRAPRGAGRALSAE